MPPALDIDLINELGRELHPSPNGLMAEDEVCPWTLFLTMSLTLLKGVLPHVPKVLPMMISDPDVRQRAEEFLISDEFVNNIDHYFIDNVKNEIQGPLNRQIIQSSETVAFIVDFINGLANNFFNSGNTPKNDNLPRYLDYNDDQLNGWGSTLGNVLKFAKTMYDLS